MTSTPGRAATSFAFSTASRVELEVAPAITGTRPATTSTVTSITCNHSSCDRVGVSPVVAQGGLVDRAVLTKVSYQRCTASSKLHENKISRMGGLAKLCLKTEAPRSH